MTSHLRYASDRLKPPQKYYDSWEPHDFMHLTFPPRVCDALPDAALYTSNLRVPVARPLYLSRSGGTSGEERQGGVHFFWPAGLHIHPCCFGRAPAAVATTTSLSRRFWAVPGRVDVVLHCGWASLPQGVWHSSPCAFSSPVVPCCEQREHGGWNHLRSPVPARTHPSSYGTEL